MLSNEAADDAATVVWEALRRLATTKCADDWSRKEAPAREGP